MREEYSNYLFSNRILVSPGKSDPAEALEALVGLASVLNIKITSGQELARRDMVDQIAYFYGVDVPKPFYEGFPKSVLELSRDQLLADQVIHYLTTYGFGLFEKAGHSVFEK